MPTTSNQRRLSSSTTPPILAKGTGPSMMAPGRITVAAKRPVGGTNQNNSSGMSKTIKTTTTSTSAKSNERNNHKTNEPSTWDGMLSARTKSTSQTTLGSPQLNQPDFNLCQFDPCRTLIFLTRELSSKLKAQYPGDRNIRKILFEIYDAVKRIEKLSPRTQSGTSIGNFMQGNRVKICNSSNQTDKYRIRFYEKAAQTDEERSWKDFIHFVTTDGFKGGVDFNGGGGAQYNRSTTVGTQTPKKVQEHGDSSSRKDASASPQDEKHSEQAELSKCRDEIAILRTELSCLKNQLKETASREASLIRELQDRCKLLQNELKTLQDIVKKQTAELTTVQELNGKLKKSSEKINLLEKSRLENDKILAFTKLEKEKLAILHEFQEHQVDALKKEMCGMCELVKKQLEKIHSTSSLLSQRTSPGPGSSSSPKNNKTLSNNGINHKAPTNTAKPSITTVHPLQIDQDLPLKIQPTAKRPMEYICHDDNSRISTRTYNNIPSETVQLHKCHSAAKCSSSAFLKQQANDLFRKKSIQRNNNFPGCESTKVTELSGPPLPLQPTPHRPHDRNMKAGNHRRHHSSPLKLNSDYYCSGCQVKAQSYHLGADDHRYDVNVYYDDDDAATPMHQHRHHQRHSQSPPPLPPPPPPRRRSSADFDFMNIYDLTSPSSFSPRCYKKMVYREHGLRRLNSLKESSSYVEN